MIYNFPSVDKSPTQLKFYCAGRNRTQSCFVRNTIDFPFFDSLADNCLRMMLLKTVVAVDLNYLYGTSSYVRYSLNKNFGLCVTKLEHLLRSFR